MSSEIPYVSLSGVSLACAGILTGLSVWLFWQKRARSDRVRNALLLLASLCLTALRAVDLDNGLDASTYHRGYFSSAVNVHDGFEPRVVRMIAADVLECIFTNALLFIYTRLMLSLVFRPDLAQQTVVYCRLRTVIYSCYAVILGLAISATCAWIYVLAVALNSSLSIHNGQAGATIAVRATVGILSLLYTLALSILTCLISHDSRFATGTMTLYQFSLTLASATFIFTVVLDLVIPDFSYSANSDAKDFVLGFGGETSLYDSIRGILVAAETLMVPFVISRGFTKRQTRGRLSRWRRAAFGDAAPPYATSDVESGSSSSSGDTAAAEKTRNAAVEVDSSPISEAAGRARAELVGEGPAELPADVEIAEMEAGKAPGESAYVKATKGYDAEVLEGAEQRAKNEAD